MSVLEPRIIDPAVNPDEANEAIARLTTTAQAPPLMQPPRGNYTTLPGGLLDADGMVHTEARVREVNGSDEEAMAKELRANMNVARLVDLMLRRTVEAIGPYDPVPPGMLDNLLVGDRSALMLAVRIATFGTDWEVTDFPCRLCNATFGTIVELDSIPIKKLDAPATQEIEVPLRNGRTATVALMTGAVQLELAAQERTIPEENTITIDRCLRKLDGQDVVPPVAQKMSMADRHKIINAMNAAQPGPQMEEVGVECTACGREATYSLSLMDLFR